MNNETVVGLDIGTSKVRAVVGQLNQRNELEILGVGQAESTGVIKGSVLNSTTTAQAIQEALKQTGVPDIDGVIVNISGQNIKVKTVPHSKTITHDIINSHDIEELVHHVRRTTSELGRVIVHIFPQEYNIGAYLPIADPIGYDATRLESNFKVISTTETDLKKIKTSLSYCNLDSKNVVFAPLANVLACLDDEDRKDGCALVDIGHSTTEIVVIEGDIIRHLASLPFGGNLLTKDIENGCRVKERQAEALKLQFGKAIAEEVPLNEVVMVPVKYGRTPEHILVKNIAIILEQRLTEIAMLVAGQLRKSGYDRKLHNGIVLTGGTAKLPLIDQLFEEILDISVRIGTPVVQVSSQTAEKIQSPEFATAVGLVWRGFREIDSREERHKRNFLQQLEVEQKESADSSSNAEKAGKFWDLFKSKNPPEEKIEKVKDPKEQAKTNWIDRLMTYGREMLTDDFKENN